MDQQYAAGSFDALQDMDLQQVCEQSKQEGLREYAFRIALDYASSVASSWRSAFTTSQVWSAGPRESFWRSPIASACSVRQSMSSASMKRRGMQNSVLFHAPGSLVGCYTGSTTKKRPSLDDPAGVPIGVWGDSQTDL